MRLKQVKTVGEAAALGDQYILTHRTDTGSVGGAAGGQGGSTRSVRSGVNVLVVFKKGHIDLFQSRETNE